MKGKVFSYLLFLVMVSFGTVSACRPTAPPKKSDKDGKNGGGDNNQNDDGGQNQSDGVDDKTPPDKKKKPSKLTIMDLQDPNSPNHPEEKTPVIIKSAVVISPVFSASKDLLGFFVSDPTFPDKYGAIMVVVEKEFSQKLKIGDEVDIEGFYMEYYNNSQINASTLRGGSVTKTGKNRKGDIRAVTVTPQQVPGQPKDPKSPDNSPAEPYEGMLIEMKDVTVESPPDQYGVWKIAGGAVVDDTFFKFTPKKGQKLQFVRGIVHFSFGVYRILPRFAADIDGATPQCQKDSDCRAGFKCDTEFGRCELVLCESDADCKTDEKCDADKKRCMAQMKTATVVQIQDPKAQGHPQVGTPVNVKGAIVTSPIFAVSKNLNGFFIADPSFPKKYGGVLVVVTKDWTDKVDVGDEVNITGRVEEYYNNTQIKVNPKTGGKIEKTGNNKKDQVKPVAVKTSELKGDPADPPDSSPAEPYEGMLVELSNLTVESEPDKFGTWKLSGGIYVDDTIFKYQAKKGETIKKLIGLVHFSFKKYRILPRSADDIQK